MLNGKRFRNFAGHAIGRKACYAAAVAAVGLVSSSAQSAVIYDVNAAPTQVDSWTIGQPTDIHHDTVTSGALYSDQTTFTGSAVFAGGSGTTKVTALLLDDIHTTASSNFTLAQFSWSVANGASVSQTISPFIRFYATDGANGGPGTLLGGLNFNGIAVSAGNVAGFFYNASASAISLPPTFWAGEFFSTTGTAANAKLIGQGTFNPPDIGSSADEDFSSTSVGTNSGSFTTANPAGTVAVSPFAGAPVANFEWEFNAVPEPTALMAIAPMAMAWLGRRRRAV